MASIFARLRSYHDLGAFISLIISTRASALERLTT